MPWIDTSKIDREDVNRLSDMERLQVYNGLDCGITFECFNSLRADMDGISHREAAELIYGFERAMMAPSFVLSRRGVLVDDRWRNIVRGELEAELGIHDNRFQRLAEAVWDKPFADRNKIGKKSEGTFETFSLNYNSHDQLKEFFYETLKCPIRYSYVKGETKVTVNREALEWFDENAKWGGIFARYIIKMRDLEKKIGVLKKQISPDGRMRCSYNVAGTETGRWSSSEDPFGDGDNLQNWTKKMRRCVVADPGYKLFSFDYAQAESFVTGGLALRDGGDRAYLEACESGDLHTAVTKEVWTEINWSGDPVLDKEKAEEIYYFALTRRDISKRLGHGSNYLGSAAHLAKITRTDKDSVINFQWKYFKKFMGIKRYHNKQIARVQMDRHVETALGRFRTFFGHPQDAATHRKAIAFDPQSTVGDMLNLGLWQVWYELDEWGPSKGPIQLLLQVHDNIVFQMPDNPDDPLNHQRQATTVKRVQELLSIPLNFASEAIVVPVDVESGWNWAPKKADKTNVDGLIPWSAAVPDDRRRKFHPAT